MTNKRRYGKRPGNKENDLYVPPFDADILMTSIDVLKISEELKVKLKSGRVETLLDVAKRREKDFYKISTFNKKNLFELKAAVAKTKISFRPEEPIDVLVGAKEANNGIKGTQNGDTRDKGRRLENARDNKAGALKSEKSAGEVRNNHPRRDDKDNRDRRAKENAQTQKNSPQKNQGRVVFDNNVSEKKTKDEKEKNRPARPKVQAVSDIYLKVNKNGKWGFADRSGKETVAPKYDEVFNYKDDMCCVELNERFGFIDRNGEEVVPVIYEIAMSYSEGYAAVFKNGYCGYIDKENNVVVDFKYDAGTPVIDGNCRVKKDGKWGELYIDRPDEVRWII